MLRARDVCKEKLVTSDLSDEKTLKRVLQIQGQASGINLCIDMIFDLINFEEDKQDAAE